MMNKIFRPKILKRKRINDILYRIFDVPIFFIVASMGYGKSTSVKNFLEKNKEIQSIWFDSSNEENDDSWVWHKFCDSIKSTDLKLSERLSLCGFPKNNMDTHEIIELIRDGMEQKTVMVIDDWYDKKTICINHLIKAIALEAIPNLHIVIISRNRPADEYIELELKKKCMIMWQTDIAFTFNETVAFFEINGVKLTEKEEKEVYEYTGGWTSATYLALLQYYNKNTFDNIPKATELIKMAVYNKFDEITRKILLKLVLLEDFTLEQAIYITGNNKANDVIKYLLSNNCFIRYDNKSKRYILHSILKSVLGEELLLSNIDLSDINNTCGDWYSKKFEYIKAIEYYYKAKKFDRVLDLMESIYTVELTSLRKRIINSMFDELNMEEKISRPIPYLTYIFFYILYGNRITGKKLLSEVKAIYEADENLKDKNQILGEVAFVESTLMFSDVKRMTRYYKKAYMLFNGGTSKIANNKTPVTFGSPHFLWLFHRKKGELKEMIDHFEKEIVYFTHISNGGATGAEYLMRAEYLFETGDLENGESFAYRALHKAKANNQTSIIICSLFLLMRIYVNKDNRHEVGYDFNGLIKEYENINIPTFLNGAKIARAYIYGITGNSENIHNWVNERETFDFKVILPVIGMSYIVLGLSMILNNSYIELEINAETMLEINLAENYIFGVLYAYIFKSIAKYRLCEMEQAKKSLLKAIDLAKEDNIIMCFVELAPHILPILKDLEKEDLYVRMLLPKCEEFNKKYIKNYSNIEKIELTPREIEVMNLVDKGYKQKEISEKLNIALITVKKHISSVYFKLKVKNKTIAINLLKRKGII